ncbi:MAG: CHASE4 domain-containing protein [Phycisphaerales bacterium]
MKSIKFSVGQKAAICIGMVFIILVGVLYLSSNTVIRQGFEDLEYQSVETNITRLHNSILRELENLETINGDWAPWDDSRDFVLGKSSTYVESNLTEDCIKNLKLNFMIFFDLQGKIVYSCFINSEGELVNNIPEDLKQSLLLQKEFFEIKDPAEAKSGMIIVSNSPILVAAQPISNSATSLPLSGTLIIGRYFNDVVIEKLRNQTCLDFKIIDNFKDLSLLSPTKNYIETVNDKLIRGYSNFYEVGTERCVTFEIEMPRDISNYGKKVIACFVFITAAGGLLCLGILLYMLRILIFNPINTLKNNFEKIDKDSNFSTKLYTEREDEIGSLARSFDTLMNHLKERIVELAEKQNTTNNLNLELMQTTEKLQEANTELKNFVYVASHDLREPLRKIVVFAEMLKSSLKDKIEGGDIENMHYMIDGAERIKKMIDGLLVYSRVSSQPHPLQKVDLNIILEQICKFELAVLIEEKNVIINKPQPLPVIVGDTTQITQLMQNLIVNGIKYQKPGNRPQITITSKPAPDGNVRIEVTDNGIGIKPEYHSAVFTMFKRLHSKEYEGTGIGLSVCKKIVERHNGKIGLDSQPDQGSTFWFTIAEVHAKTAVEQTTA